MTLIKEAHPPGSPVSTRIRAGLQLSIEERQERWDRMKAWEKADKSLADIQNLEYDYSGLRFSRERIRQILAGAKPGTVGRPKLRGLLTRRSKLVERLNHWASKDTEHSREEVERLQAELEQVKQEIVQEQRR